MLVMEQNTGGPPAPRPGGKKKG